MDHNFSIGIFDSGYGGLTVFKSIKKALPMYNYIYLGDNARAPYGDHSFETVYKYTFECVEWLLKKECKLIILACNTASAKALRAIQQTELLTKYPGCRVLGVIRPTAECIGDFSITKNVGILGTTGTVKSNTYVTEIQRFFPKINVYQQSCPMWVPLIEQNEHLSIGAEFFVKKYMHDLLNQDAAIDTVLLACTHYPLLLPAIQKVVPESIKILSQGEIVAKKLIDYLGRHPEIESCLSKTQQSHFFTTGDQNSFDSHGSLFFGEEIHSKGISIS